MVQNTCVHSYRHRAYFVSTKDFQEFEEPRCPGFILLHKKILSFQR